MKPPIQNFITKCNTVQFMLVIWDSIRQTKVIRYKIDVKFYKNGWIGNVLAGDCVQVVHNNFKYM